MTRTKGKRRAKVVGMRTKRKIGKVKRDDSGGDSDERNDDDESEKESEKNH